MRNDQSGEISELYRILKQEKLQEHSPLPSTSMNICLLTFPMTIFMSIKSLDNISNFFSDNISWVQIAIRSIYFN